MRYAAPVLVFTAEEVWTTRFPERGSVHLQELHPLPEDWVNPELATRFEGLREVRERVMEAIEPLRREKVIRSSLEAEVTVPDLPLAPEALAEVFIVAKVGEGDGVTVKRTDYHKCGRCWRLLPEVVADGALCDRCAGVVS